MWCAQVVSSSFITSSKDICFSGTKQKGGGGEEEKRMKEETEKEAGMKMNSCWIQIE